MAYQEIEHRREGPESMGPLPIAAHLHAAGNAPAGSSSLLFGADRSVDGWDDRGLGRLASAVSRAIAQFSPRDVPDAVWDRIGPFIRDAAHKAAPRSAYSARPLMTVVTELVIWIDSVGLPMEPAVVFHPDNIDRFIKDGCAHFADGTRSNYRRQLRLVGAAVIGVELFPATPLPIPRPPPLAPYPPSEIAMLRSWCRGLPSEAYRRGIATILAFGLGTGITSPELYRMLGTDVSVEADGVTVHVTGARQRDIPVLEMYADEVAKLARDSGNGPVFAHQRSGSKTGKSQVTNFIFTCPKGDAPHLNPLRLRNTWLVHHLSAGTHFIALAEASGVEVAQIGRLAIYATIPDPNDARRMLREARLS